MTADTNPPAASAAMSATADECNRLRAENTGLRHEVSALSAADSAVTIKLVTMLRAENAGLHHTVSQLSGEVGTLRAQVSALRAEREKMRVRLFDFAWEMARSQK